MIVLLLYLSIHNYCIFFGSSTDNPTIAVDRYFSLYFPYFKLTDLLLYFVIAVVIYEILINETLSPIFKIVFIILLLIVPIILLYPAIALYNASIGLIATNGPIHIDKEKYFPYHKIFEDPENFKVIRNEVMDLLKEDKLDCFHKYHTTDIDNNEKKTCWKWFPLLNHNGFIEENCNKLPFLYSLIKNEFVNEKLIGSAAISILEPKMNIPPHRGYLKNILRYHLGIIIPTDKKPFLICDGKKYYWKEGEGIMFDDMYVHYVKNPSQYRRAVLFIDVLRNDLPEPSNTISNFLYTVIIRNKTLTNIDNKMHQQIKNNSESESESTTESKLLAESDSK